MSSFAPGRPCCNFGPFLPLKNWGSWNNPDGGTCRLLLIPALLYPAGDEPLTDKADREPCQDHQAGFLYPLPGLPGSGRQVEVGRLHLWELRELPGRGQDQGGALAGTG